MNPLFPLVAAGLVLALFGLAAVLFRDSGSAKASERLDTLVGKRRKESAEEILLKKSAQESDKKNLLDLMTPKFLTLQKVFEQADCNIKPSVLFGTGVGLGVLFATFSYLLTRGNNLIAVLAPPVVGFLGLSMPFLWLLNKRRVRLKLFAEQLPDALELVGRALRAGHSLGAGMHVVGEEMPSPVADEFGRVYEEQNLGISLEDAMRNMCERVPNLDLRFFVTSVAIQRQTGGDLAEILDKIGYVVRERYRILGQVKALTAEGRLSGVVLIALPIFLFILMLHTKPDYISLLWTHETGVKWLIGAILLQIVGAIAIKKIVDIKV